jgi:hypothetical protein
MGFKKKFKVIIELEKGFMITTGSDEDYYFHPGIESVLVWTTAKKAEKFIQSNNFSSDKVKVIEETRDEIIDIAISKKFASIKFDFKLGKEGSKKSFARLTFIEHQTMILSAG